MRTLPAFVGSAIFIALLALAGTARADPAAARDLSATLDAGLQRGLERVVRDLGLADEVGAKRLALALVDATDANAPRLAMLNGNEMMYAASLPKVAILLGAFAEAEAGRLPLDERRLEAMTNMIRYSSNDDASRVLDWVGRDRLLEILQSDRYRFYDAAGAGGLWVGKTYGKDGAYRRDPVRHLSHGATAFQVARLYCLLASDALLSPRLNEMMKAALSESRHPPQVRQGPGEPAGRADLPQVRHVEGFPCRQRAGRVRRPPLCHRRPRRAPARRRLAGATRGAAARSRRIPCAAGRRPSSGIHGSVALTCEQSDAGRVHFDPGRAAISCCRRVASAWCSAAEFLRRMFVTSVLM